MTTTPPTDIPCPTCGATAGSPCTRPALYSTSLGQRNSSRTPHPARVEAAQRQRRGK